MTYDARLPNHRLSVRLLRTNPIACIEENAHLLRAEDPKIDVAWTVECWAGALAESELCLPPECAQHLVDAGLLGARHEIQVRRRKPGVVGLVVEEGSGRGLVAPLTVKAADQWNVTRDLPFDPQNMLDLMVRLLGAGGIDASGAFPEGQAFEISSPLDAVFHGTSMNIAGLIAILDALGGHKDKLLRAACALIEEKDGALRPVGSVKVKLGAFVREIGRGTLMVRAREDAEAAAFDGSFATVWKIESMTDLGNHLNARRLLRPLLRRVILDKPRIEFAWTRLHYLRDQQHRWPEALDFVDRLQSCRLSKDLPIESRLARLRAAAQLYRRLGWHARSTKASRRVADAVHRGATWQSYETMAEADVALAASLYDSHCFKAGTAILDTWLRRIDKDPTVVSPTVRIKVWNTAARTLLAAGRTGWEPLFERSLALQRLTEPTSVPRTRNDLIHALLRTGQLERARSLIVAQSRLPVLDGLSRQMFAVCRAEYKRLMGHVWSSADLEGEEPSPAKVGHILAFYWLATARQSRRDPMDRAHRFHRAGEFFRVNVTSTPDENIQTLMADVMAVGEAACTGDGKLWKTALARIDAFLRKTPNRPIRDFYSSVRRGLGPAPDLSALDRFLDRMPHV